jgi:hypothetical protein
MANMAVDLNRQTKGTLPLAKVQNGANFVQKDGSVPFEADQSHGGFKITSLGAAVADSDAPNWGQVKQAIRNVLYRRIARAMALGNVNIASPGATHDGVTLSNGDVLFLPNQTTQSENGLYTFNGASSALTRTADADGGSEVQPGLAVFVSEGSTKGNSRWNLITDGAITVGTTNLVFSEEVGGGTYTAGNGLQLVGNEFSVKPVSGGAITATGGGVDVDATKVPLLANIVHGEVPSGTVNGSNTNFGLANTPLASTLKVYLNGLRQRGGAGNDYTLSGTTITFATAPSTGDYLEVEYLK